MARLRHSFDQGHNRKFLVVIDETPECDRALFYAARRAEHTGGQLVMLYVIPPGDFQHWLGVEAIMRAEADEKAKDTLAAFAEKARAHAKVDPELIVREGRPAEQILELINEDEDVAVLVLAAARDSEGPGPLISSLVARAFDLVVPITIVPGDLSDEEIEAIA